MWGAPIRLSARRVNVEGALISSIVTQGAVYGRFADKEALALASALLPDELTFADLEATLRAVYRRGISAEIGSTEAELLRSAS